jgi:hypothetical protein
MKSLIVTLSLLLFWLSGSALAGDVYINGTKLGAVADVELKGVSVRFDSEGNIHVTAPGYNVVAPGGENQNAEMPEQKLKGNYCLVADTGAPGVVPFRFEVYMNGTLVGQLSSDQAMTVLSLTEHVVVGKNRVSIKALHDTTRMVSPPMRRKSVRIRAGEGIMAGGQCNLTSSPILYTRLARDTGDREDTFTFVAR